MDPSAVNKSFSHSIPYLQIAWDSTSIGTFKECPYKYKLTIIDGWQSKIGNAHLIFGLVYHSATEHYAHARAEGKSHDEGIKVALRHALTETWDEKLNRPWISDEPTKTRKTLLRTVIWYLDQHPPETDSLQTIILSNGKPALEVSFRFELDAAPQQEPGTKFILCGHLDRLAQMNGETFITDKKSTKHALDSKYFSQYAPDNQMSTYSFAGRVVSPNPIRGVAIEGAQIGVTFSRFRREFIHRTDEQLDEWYQGLEWMFRQAEAYAKAQFWPQNDKACFNCGFREICRRPPSVRDQWLKGAFVKRVWDPLQVRGEL